MTPLPSAPVRGGSRPESTSRTILVLAGAEPGAELIDALRGRGPDAETDVLVVAPALASRVGFWTNDDRWRRRAEELLAGTARMLAAAGIASRGSVGDPDPVQALDDALRSENVTELIVVHSTAERASWLERELLRCMGERHVVPTTTLAASASGPAGAGRWWSRRRRLATAALLALTSLLVVAAVGTGAGRLLAAIAGVFAVLAVNVGPKLGAVAAVWLAVRHGRRHRGRRSEAAGAGREL